MRSGAKWLGKRGPLAMAVMNEMWAAGVYVFSGGLGEGLAVGRLDTRLHPLTMNHRF
jgi:hypothetical protein